MDPRQLRAIGALIAAALAGLLLLVATDDRAIGDGVSLDQPRITAAVFGLFGLGPDPAFRAVAESITVPLLFLFQFHDELMTPEAGLKLWEAFGSKEKTMHINPGPHVGIPVFERASSVAFFNRHLG